MKLYSPCIDYQYHLDKAAMSEDPDGLYVLRSEAEAEIDRLRGLVEAAYHEGFDKCCSRGAHPAAWLHSDARKSLTPPTPTPNRAP